MLKVSILDLGCEMEQKYQVRSTEHGHGIALGRVSEMYVVLWIKEVLHWATTA